MSYRSKKRRCSFCGSVGRNVDYHPLSGLFLHYECWLTETRLNLRQAMLPKVRDYDQNGSTPDLLPDHPFHLTDRETLDLFE